MDTLTIEQRSERMSWVRSVDSLAEMMSEDWAVLGGERTKLQVAHFKLSHGRAFLL